MRSASASTRPTPSSSTTARSSRADPSPRPRPAACRARPFRIRRTADSMLQLLIDTLLRASDLALVALGLSTAYGLVKFPNIAHVQIAMVGAYATFALHAAALPLPLAIALAAIATGALTLVLHVAVFQRLLRGGP